MSRPCTAPPRLAGVAPALLACALIAWPAAASAPVPAPPPPASKPAPVPAPAGNAVGPASAPVVPAGPAPALVVERENLDLGRIDEGQDGVATFVLKNTGSAELKIVSARPG